MSKLIIFFLLQSMPFGFFNKWISKRFCLLSIFYNWQNEMQFQIVNIDLQKEVICLLFVQNIDRRKSNFNCLEYVKNIEYYHQIIVNYLISTLKLEFLFMIYDTIWNLINVVIYFDFGLLNQLAIQIHNNQFKYNLSK